jgi:MYXO-CTERM domain-containing protein
MCISGQGFTGFGGGIAFDLNDLGQNRQLYDASAYTGISFWARGLPVQFRAMVVDKYSDPAGAVCSGCYDHFQAPFTPTDDWQQYSFSWKELKQQGYGDMQPNVCAAEIFQFQFQWSGSAPFELCLDDVAFTTAAGTPAEGAGSTAPIPPVLTAGGGCNCRTAQRSNGGKSALLLLTLLTLTTWRRRKERSSRARHSS